MAVALNEQELTALEELARQWGISVEHAACRVVGQAFAQVQEEAEAAIARAQAE